MTRSKLGCSGKQGSGLDPPAPASFPHLSGWARPQVGFSETRDWLRKHDLVTGKSKANSRCQDSWGSVRSEVEKASHPGTPEKGPRTGTHSQDWQWVLMEHSLQAGVNLSFNLFEPHYSPQRSVLVHGADEEIEAWSSWASFQSWSAKEPSSGQ